LHGSVWIVALMAIATAHAGTARAADFKAQTHTVYHSLKYPSAILVDVPTVGKPRP
jgi:hypothetical protein